MNTIGIGSLFRSKTDKKPTAAVFVDFEHWYISLSKIHNEKPNIKGFAKLLSRKYDIKDITFFGDFSNPSLSSEILKIRAVTNHIIQTSNTGNYKKDFTDFIMLDHIYQKAMFSNDIDAFIIFSGDGHFASVASCLKNNCGKEVGIYGVRDAFSNQLKEIASWYKEVPTDFDLNEKYFDMIFTNLKDVDKTGRVSRPSFIKTVQKVSSLYGVSEDKIRDALNVLIENGYLKKKEEKIENRKIMFLDFDWDKIEADEIWVKNPNLKKVSEEKQAEKKPAPKKILKPQNKEIAKKQKEVKKPEPKKENNEQPKKEGQKTITQNKPSNKTRRRPKKKSVSQKIPEKEPIRNEEKPKTVQKAETKAVEKPKQEIKKVTEEPPTNTAKKKKRRRYYPPKQSSKTKAQLKKEVAQKKTS